MSIFLYSYVSSFASITRNFVSMLLKTALGVDTPRDAHAASWPQALQNPPQVSSGHPLKHHEHQSAWQWPSLREHHELFPGSRQALAGIMSRRHQLSKPQASIMSISWGLFPGSGQALAGTMSRRPVLCTCAAQLTASIMRISSSALASPRPSAGKGVTLM